MGGRVIVMSLPFVFLRLTRGSGDFPPVLRVSGV
jgi:hypothetical protein